MFFFSLREKLCVGIQWFCEQTTFQIGTMAERMSTKLTFQPNGMLGTIEVKSGSEGAMLTGIAAATNQLFLALASQEEDKRWGAQILSQVLVSVHNRVEEDKIRRHEEHLLWCRDNNINPSTCLMQSDPPSWFGNAAGTIYSNPLQFDPVPP